MDKVGGQLLTQFFSLPTFMFTLGLGILVVALRRLVERVSERVADASWWTSLILPSLPVILGGIIAMVATMYPFPEIFAKAASARFFYGIVCGFFSSKVYRIGRALLKKYLQAQGIDPNYLESDYPPKIHSGSGGPK
jgi:energy-converting hydrogenase Eha subunit A